jgi:hypothetical protein
MKKKDRGYYIASLSQSSMGYHGNAGVIYLGFANLQEGRMLLIFLIYA